MARRARFSRGSRSKGHVQWVPFSGGIESVAAASSIIALVTINAAGTLLRTRGDIYAQIDAPTDNDKTAIHWGLMVADDDRVAAGATAFPDPGADASNKFFAFGTICLAAQAANLEHGVTARFVIDSKAMRKFTQDDQIVLVVQNTAFAGAPAVDVLVAGRVLFQT